jgi:hypothetical protein
VDAVDKRTQQPVQEPVFLNADGTEMDREQVRSGAKKPLTAEMSGYPLVNFAPLNVKI